MMALLALVSHAIAHPDRGVAAEHYKSNPDANISRLRWLWYTLGVGMPLMLAGLATVGYLYTAAVLSKLLVDTIWMAFGMIVVGMIVIRWLALARRKIEWQIALDKRAAQLSEKTADTDDESSPGSEGDLPAPEIRPLDLDLVDQQTRRILQSGLFLIAVLALWGIWSEELPAFNMLDSVALWSKTVIVDGIQTIAPVTVADLMLGLVIAAVTFIASSNLPGLMELTVLQRLELQPGSRYAINTVVRYIVVTIGVIAILNVIGWDWSQIQWLVAALSVGLGFGLQEIVANFVSGLVILFERPVRVGDTVTVGELTGTVSRIRIRATTITDWDRKEIIVPNKSFITEQVVNWTLSDPITRIVIPVGISYGSDVELAHKVMTETLHALPLVLDEPPPNVYFTGFGESSLDFRLHVYSRQLTDRMPLMHAVHQSILGALRKHGIEIPFPQRDLHLRSSFESSDKRQDD
jgi:potassium efflux system protein